jgi:hypothetical protein
MQTGVDFTLYLQKNKRKRTEMEQNGTIKEQKRTEIMHNRKKTDNFARFTYNICKILI